MTGSLSGGIDYYHLIALLCSILLLDSTHLSYLVAMQSSYCDYQWERQRWAETSRGDSVKFPLKYDVDVRALQFYMEKYTLLPSCKVDERVNFSVSSKSRNIYNVQNHDFEMKRFQWNFENLDLCSMALFKNTCIFFILGSILVPSRTSKTGFCTEYCTDTPNDASLRLAGQTLSSFCRLCAQVPVFYGIIISAGGVDLPQQSGTCRETRM